MIGVTDSKSDSWNTTILKVVGRTETSILVRTSNVQPAEPLTVHESGRGRRQDDGRVGRLKGHRGEHGSGSGGR